MTKRLSETKTSLRFTTPEVANASQRESSADDDAGSLDQLIDELNSSVQPPNELSASDVVIRTMYLVSDQVNQYYGKFDLSELDKIARLCVDAPVLTGHRKDRLPVGRVFKAELIARNNENWVKVYFYWLRDVSDSQTMADNIDGGIYKECSLGFVYTKAECVKCGNDIRECGHHIVNQIVNQPDPQIDSAKADPTKVEPLFYYKGTQRILEISLVYRGATHNTKISNDLEFRPAESSEDDQRSVSKDSLYSVKAKDWLAELSIVRERIIVSPQKYFDDCDFRQTYSANRSRALPLYDGLALVLSRHDGALSVLRDDLSKAPDALGEKILKQIQFPEHDFAIYGRLVGMRGKERRSLAELIRFLRDEGGPVRFARFYALATLYHHERAMFSPDEMDTEKVFAGADKKSRYLSCPRSIELSKCAATDSLEIISTIADNEFAITRVCSAVEFTHKLTESEVSVGTVVIKSKHGDNAPDLYIELGNSESLRGRANTNVQIRGAGAEMRDGRVCLTNSRIAANLYDYAIPEDKLNCEMLIGEKSLVPAERRTQALGKAFYERLVQPGILVRASAEEFACLAGNGETEITLGSVVPEQKPIRVRIIRLSHSDKSELALLRVVDTKEKQICMAA